MEMFESYFDGLSPEIAEQYAKMTPEEIEADIEKEKKKCESLPDW